MKQKIKQLQSLLLLLILTVVGTANAWGDPVVFEAYGEKVSAGGAFTNKTTDLTSCAFSNKETYSTSIVSSHTANTGEADVFRTGSQSTITLTLGSTSASSIVVGAKSSASTARTLSSIQVSTDGGSSWETLSSSTYSVSNDIAGSTVNESTISGLNIAQGSKVKLTYNSGVLFYYFEVTPVSGGASTDATLKTVVVNGHTLTADGTTYTYNIGTEQYASGATIPVTVTPNDNNATIGGETGEKVINATIGTPLDITVTAEDGTTTKTYTVNVNSVAKTELGGNSFAVASGASYYEGQQFATTSDKVIASISTNFGYEKISANQRENFADSYYAYNLVTDNANTQTQDGGVPTSGVYYRFATAAGTSGYLQVGMFLMNGKKLYVVDGDGNNVSYTYKFMSDATTELIMTDQQLATAATGYIQFAISANKTYYVYANGSKLSLMGFKYSEVSSDASADFTLKGTSVVFTNDAYTYTATTETEGTTLPVVITPATGATVTSVTNATIVSDNNYTITVPSAGSSASATFTITAQDGITTETYTIRVDKPIASTTLFNLEVGTISSDVKAGAGETVDITTTSPSYASTLTGGTAQMGLTDIATKDYTLISSRDYFNFGTNVAYMKIALESPLQVGDIIEFTSYGTSDKQFAITTTDVRSTNNLTSGNKYTVTSTSTLAGQSIIYFWRAEASSSYITKLKITRPTATTDVTVKINNTTVARGSGSGTSGDRYIYAYVLPSDYAGGTVPVSISTTGTISGTITSVTAPAYGSTTTKDFSVTGGGSTTYYRLSVTRAASTDCTITGATASDATAGDVSASVSGTNIAVLVPYDDGSSATDVTLGVTVPTGASASWEGSTNTVSLAGAAGSTAMKEVTVTAQDGTTQKTYTFTVTRGEDDNSYLQVVGDGQEIYLHDTNYGLYKTSGGTKGRWFGSSNPDKFNKAATYDGVTDYWYELKSNRTLTIDAKGAIAYEVYVQNTGDGAREYKVNSDGTGKEKTISAEAKALSSSGLIKTNTDGGNGQVTITITGHTGNTLYPVKIVFYTTTAAKKAVTMSYSAAEWDGTGAQPTLTAKDEDNNDVSPVTYESDDTKVATVADNGTVTILPTANGNAMIYATYAGDATHEAASAYFIVIKQQGAKYKQIKEDTQDIGDKAFLYTDGSTYGGGTIVPAGNDILVTATYGGWKYGDHSYYKSGKKYEDDWGVGITGKVSDGIDGYDYARVGAQDACDEAKETESYYGENRYGWFHPAEIDDEGKLVSYPFTLPCRGAYMTFEPTVNGMLTLYLHQNGAWNTDGNGKIKHGEFRKHAFHIVDQNGVSVSTYTDFATNTKGKVTAKKSDTEVPYYCSVDAYGNATDESIYNIATWDEFKNYYTTKERVDIAAAWSSGVKGAQKVVRLDNGSFFITHPASVKYSFYVVAGQTYYVFSNFSKLGFMGMNFVPDTENEVTGSLSLSENEKFSFEDLQKPSGNVSVPQYAEITLDRTFTAGNWNTICLPFTMTEAEVKANFGDDTELLVLDHVDMVGTKAEVHLKYHEIQSILPGYPYLIKPSQDCNGIVVNNKIVDPNTELFKIKDGSYTSRGVEGFCNPQEDLGPGKYRSYRLKEGDIFLSSNKLYVSKGASYLKGYRSYFEIAEDAPVVPNSVELFFSDYGEDGDQETAISILEFSDEALEAFGITRNGVYNLNGQKVADTTENLPAGMYIVNGKKMYVK